jgi:hypothetical protein
LNDYWSTNLPIVDLATGNKPFSTQLFFSKQARMTTQIVSLEPHAPHGIRLKKVLIFRYVMLFIMSLFDVWIVK